MADLLSEIAKMNGCAPDGGMRNPMSNLVDGFGNGIMRPRGVVGPRPRGAIQQHMDNSMMLRNAFNRTRPQMQPTDMKMNGMIDDFRRARMLQQRPTGGPSIEAAWRSSATTSNAAPRQMMMDPRVRMNAQHAMHMRQAMMYQQQMAMMSRPMMMPMVRPPVHAPQPVVQRAVTQSNITTEQRVESDDTSALQRTAGQVADMLKQKSDPKFKNSEFVNFMSKVKTGEVKIKDNVVTESTTTTSSSSKESDLLPWYQTAMENARQSETIPLGDRMESAWRDALNGKVDMETAWKRTMDATSLLNNTPLIQEKERTYEFVEKNPYEKDVSAFLKGQAAFKKGEINDAIYLLESAVQQDDSNAEAWRLLGQSHAENDCDPQAIICLERAVERDPYNLPALLALGVSYVNELDHNKALENLQAWVQHNPKFAGLEIVKDAYSDGSLVDEVMQLMLKALAHSGGKDPDVLEVLGVLYNVSRDYNNAVKTFKDALSNRPDDYGLWNKVGATLANSARSEEAMPAYHRALKLRPKYARGYLNLGICHANLNNYSEAARHYLTALTLNSKASHIWSYLRIAFTCLDRFDLAKLTDKRDVSLFKDEFTLPDF